MNNFAKPEIDNKNILSFLLNLVLCLGYLIFGLIFDYHKFKPLIKVTTFIEIISPIMILILDVSNLSFYLIILISFFIFGANIVLLYSELTRIYGILSGPEILSINSVFVGIIYLIMLCLKRFVLRDDIHFNIIYIICGILCFGKFIVLFFLKENFSLSELDSKQDIRKVIDETI